MNSIKNIPIPYPFVLLLIQEILDFPFLMYWLVPKQLSLNRQGSLEVLNWLAQYYKIKS